MDCLANAPSIRAQNLRLNFEEKMANALDDSQRVSLNSCLAGQWLTIRLQGLGIIVTFSLAVIAVFNAVYDIAPVSASMLGLSLSYAFALVGYLNGLVNSVIETEQEMISVERMDEYIQLPSEFPPSDEDQSALRGAYKIPDTPLNSSTEHKNAIDQPELDNLWPLNGSIVLRNVSFSYENEKRFTVHNEASGKSALNRAKQTVLSTLSRLRSVAGASHDYAPFSNHSSSDESDGLGVAEERGVRYALRNVSVVIPAGARVAVVGRTGNRVLNYSNTEFYEYPNYYYRKW